MKTKNIFIISVFALLLTSCDSFLTQYPQGGTLLENQYQQLDDAVEGSIMGIYSNLYTMWDGEDHSSFGQRALDMYGDITSGDMAMAKSGYGWFEDYERGYFYASARSVAWSFYYNIIFLCNKCIAAVDANGVPNLPAEGEEVAKVIASQGFYYGQVMALRGWAYACLMRYYVEPSDAIADMSTEYAFPIYTESDVIEASMGKGRSTVEDGYNRIYEDLKTGVDYMDAFGRFVQRASKLELDAECARTILAYAMLNKGTKESYEIAYKYAKEVVENGGYPILPNTALTETGFANVEAANWMWGSDITVETTGGLATFWGHTDIHTYSYAWIGDVKGIDSKLYDEIPSWDGRKNWWRDKDGKGINDLLGKGNSDYAYAPDGKFFSPKYRYETDEKSIDREWLCDNVYLRVEVAYLIAAEAALFKETPDEAECLKYLDAIMSKRLNPLSATAAADYDTYKATLSGIDNLKNALIYNWRVEMWGEGYGLQTLRRLSKEVELGTNHLSRAGMKLNGADEYYTLQIPTSETRYNPFIGREDQLKKK